MKIVACVKEVLDPDLASSVFRVDEDARKVISLPGSRSVMSPFDEQAIEVALRIREALGEGSITLLSLGAETARSIVKHGLALDAHIDRPSSGVRHEDQVAEMWFLGPLECLPKFSQAISRDAEQSPQ